MIALALLGCNRYELFRVSGGEADAPRAADLLFVIDDSPSMREETASLAEGFARFVASLQVDDRALVDWRIALTTTDAGGRRGALVGERPVLAEGEDDAADVFVHALLCEVACFESRTEAPSDPSFTCAAPGTFGGTVSRESLDCLCGADGWLDHCGSANEQPLEAVLDAMCRAADPAPALVCDQVPAGERGAIPGFLRPEATLVPVVLTDEGDSSPRIATLDADPGPYGKAYAQFGPPADPPPMVWAVVGPTLDEDGEKRCPGLPQPWAVKRLEVMVESTGGLYQDVFAEDCGPQPLGSALDRLGALVSKGGAAVTLPAEPVLDTLVVTVGGRAVDRAEVLGDDVFQLPTWSDGWEWRAATRTVVLHGDAVPQGDDLLEVYWLPARAE